MANSFKKGFDWFPFDVNFFRNKKVRMVRGRYGSDGVEFLLYLFCQIHIDGFYSKIDDDFYYIAADDLGFSYEKIEQMMNFFLGRSLFEDTLFKTDKVLTSRRIQKQFQDLVKSRKQIAEVDANLWLLDENETKGCIKVTLKKETSKKNTLNSRKNNLNSKKTDTEDSRVEESRVYESTVEEKGAATSDSAIAVFHKYEQLIGIVTPAVRDGIDFYIENGVESALIVRIIEYACEQGKRTWSYIKAAIRGNMDADIKTLDAYNRAQADRAENAKKAERANKGNKKSKFHYEDGNKPDYSKFANEILADMLGEGGKE